MLEEVDQIRVDLEILLSSTVARIASLQDDLELCEAGGTFKSNSKVGVKSKNL